MRPIGLGDLAQAFQLRGDNLVLKQRLQHLSRELATGQSADPGGHLKGDFAPLAALRHGLSVQSAYSTTTAEAATAAAAIAQSLEVLGSGASEASQAMLLAGNASAVEIGVTAGADARGKLDTAVSALNISVAGRSLFAGASADRAALAPAEQIMAAVRSAVAGETTAVGVIATVSAWFDTPGGGFETLAYGGSASPLGPVRLSERESLTFEVSAAAPEIRDMLRGLVTGALLEDSSFLAGDAVERGELARLVGSQLLEDQSPLSVLVGKVGVAENRIEAIRAENASKTAMLEMALDKLIGVDQYDSAVELETVQGQLETLYTITARMMRLSLSDYI